MSGYSGSAPAVPIAGSDDLFAIHRIYCIGRNYAAHAREMGSDPTRERPFFFMKPADAVVLNGRDVPYPPRTQILHYEGELVVAIGRAGFRIEPARARDIVFGYAVGNDLTRRDLQNAAKETGRPWETGKAFDASAPVSAIHRVEDVGHLDRGALWLSVNGVRRQSADISQMIWNVPELIAELSEYFALQPGDLIFTGTPEGVGRLEVGDRVEVGVAGLHTLVNRIVEALPP